MIPIELIPRGEMTVPEFWQYIGMAKAHPRVRNINVRTAPTPGKWIMIRYREWNVKYNILIIDNTDWDEFNSLREDWEMEKVA